MTLVHLVPKVFRVYLEPLALKVHKGLKVKQAILVLLDRLAKTVFMVNVDQLDPKEKRENQVFKEHLDQEAFLDQKDPKEAQVTRDSQDPMVSQENKDPRVSLERMVSMEKRENLETRVKLVLPVKWACLARQENLGPKDQLVFKAVLDSLVTKATRERRDCPVHKDLQVTKVFTDLKDHLDCEDLLGQLVMLDRQVNLVKQVILDHSVRLECEEKRVIGVEEDLKGIAENLVLPDARVKLEKREKLVNVACKGQLDLKENL